MLHTVSQQRYTPEAIERDTETQEGTIIIESRFGQVEVSTENPLIFPQGLLGIAGNFEYALTDFPNPKLGRFKLLQSLNDHSVSFITLPIDLENTFYEKDDLVKAAADVGVEDIENLVILLVVSVHRTPNDVKLSVNTRAPLLVYIPTRNAAQYVFQTSKYQVQHMLEFAGKI